ncbi:MAG: LLM class flavin-dependent oxidoreductase [Candidatus Binatia bacterium]
MVEHPLEFDLGFSSRTVAAYPVERRIEIVRMAEALGFARLWHSNEKFGRDMVASMTLSATQTRTIKIGAAVADPYSVHPALTASAIATVDEISGGRALVAMGAGGSGFPAMGIGRVKPATAIREAIEIMRGMWRGETVTLKGKVIRIYGGRINFSARQDIPIFIATRGGAVLRMAGEVADGVMIATMATPEGVSGAWNLVVEGTEKASRSPADLEVMSRVDCCVDPDQHRAREGVKLMIAFLLWSSYPDRSFVAQVGLKVPDELEALIARREYELMDKAGHLVPEDFVDAFAWAGTPEEVARKIGSVVNLGIRRVGCWVLPPPGGDLESVVKLLAEKVIPRVRERTATPRPAQSEPTAFR